MAAPKLWGFTRAEPITDELLVSWTDGDLTADLSRELEERLLAHPDERRKLAAYARAIEDAVRPVNPEAVHAGERFEAYRQPLEDMCVAVGTTPAGEFPDNVAARSRLPRSRLAAGALLVAAAAVVAFWLLRG